VPSKSERHIETGSRIEIARHIETGRHIETLGRDDLFFDTQHSSPAFCHIFRRGQAKMLHHGYLAWDWIFLHPHDFFMQAFVHLEHE
jgi:hypothetical protein